MTTSHQVILASTQRILPHSDASQSLLPHLARPEAYLLGRVENQSVRILVLAFILHQGLILLAQELCLCVLHLLVPFLKEREPVLALVQRKVEAEGCVLGGKESRSKLWS